MIERHARPAVLAIAGFRWRRAVPADAGEMERVASLNAHRTLFALPASEEEFAARIDRPGFNLAMLCARGPTVFGAGAISLRNNRSLNVRAIAFFEDPLSAAPALAAYVRHVFWTLPMHRIYVQLPCIPEEKAYREALLASGFEAEGVVRGHALVEGSPCDVECFGVLRRDFEAWCLKNQSLLAL